MLERAIVGSAGMCRAIQKGPYPMIEKNGILTRKSELSAPARALLPARGKQTLGEHSLRPAT